MAKTNLRVAGNEILMHPWLNFDAGKNERERSWRNYLSAAARDYVRERGYERANGVFMYVSTRLVGETNIRRSIKRTTAIK